MKWTHLYHRHIADSFNITRSWPKPELYDLTAEAGESKRGAGIMGWDDKTLLNDPQRSYQCSTWERIEECAGLVDQHRALEQTKMDL